MKPLRVEFDMTRGDMELLIQTILERSPLTKHAFRNQKIIMSGVLLLLVFGQVWLFVLKRDFDFSLLVPTAFLGAFYLWMWPDKGRFRRLARKQVHLQLQTEAGRAALGPRTVEVGRDGLTVESDHTSGLVRWSGVFEVIPTKEHLFLVILGPGYLPIPRRAFEYDDDFHRFCDAVAELVAIHRSSGKLE